MRRWLITLTLLGLMSACAPRASFSINENFDDTRNGWTLAHTSQADITIESGQLQVAVKQPDSVAWSIMAGKTFDDLTLDIDATPVSGPDDNDYGIIVRHVNDDNFYRFEISADGYFHVQKRERGKWQPLVPDWTATEAIRKGKVTNHLRVVCAGPSMTFYVNQVQLIQITDTLFARGEIGVLAGTLTQPGVRVAFDNLRVNR